MEYRPTRSHSMLDRVKIPQPDPSWEAKRAHDEDHELAVLIATRILYRAIADILMAPAKIQKDAPRWRKNDLDTRRNAPRREAWAWVFSPDGELSQFSRLCRALHLNPEELRMRIIYLAMADVRICHVSTLAALVSASHFPSPGGSPDTEPGEVTP